jgi:hypothetical protein
MGEQKGNSHFDEYSQPEVNFCDEKMCSIKPNFVEEYNHHRETGWQ